jgi:hypothetical protein
VKVMTKALARATVQADFIFVVRLLLELIGSLS